ncbi:MAG: (deoxy)nucleoside triphosphate pyrophosphohydrolase [Myxococcaceae bacterium]|nr:(deoxy)nucleoside triphosphate pyrophosphohydrolase [Myxococcaceae bacterium]
MGAGRHIRVVGAMLEKDTGRYLITQRRPEASLPLKWEFPGGRVRDGETDSDALVRAIKDRLGLDIFVDAKATTMQHEYEDYTVDFAVFHCRLKDLKQDVSHAKVNDHRWVQLGEMGNYEFPDADARTVDFLLEADG